MCKRFEELIETLKQEVSEKQVYFLLKYFDNNKDSELKKDRNMLIRNHNDLHFLYVKISSVLSDFVGDDFDDIKAFKKYIKKNNPNIIKEIKKLLKENE